MENSSVGTPPVRKAFGSRMVNSLKLSFPAHFRNTENNISHNFCSFNLTVGLLKMYIFLLLNVLSILIYEEISRTDFLHLTGYFLKFSDFTCNSKPLKKTSSVIGLSVSV